MSSTISWVITLLLISLVISLMKKNKQKELDTSSVNDTVLKLPAYILVLGIIDFILFAGFAVFFYITSNGTDPIWIPLAFMLFAFLGLYLVYSYIIEKFTFDDNGVDYRKFTAKKIRLEWNNIESIKYSALMTWFIIKDGDGNKAYFSIMLKGMKPFAIKIINKVNKEKIYPKALKILNDLKDGKSVLAM